MEKNEYDNPIQYDDLTSSSKEEYDELRNRYLDSGWFWVKVKTINTLLILTILFSLFAHFGLKDAALRNYSLLVLLLLYGWRSSRIEHFDGFMLGYEDGKEEGIQRALNIDADHARKLREEAIEIKVHSRH